MEFNKAHAGGFQAEVRAYAYLKTTREVTNHVSGNSQSQTVYYLYYLDIITRDAQTLNAILPGLVKEPAPNPVRLYFENKEGELTDEAQEEGLLMWAAEKAQVGARKLYSTALKKSCAYQGVLVPAAALGGLDSEEHSRNAGGSKAEKPGWFILLILDNISEMHQFKLSELYHARLNKLVSIPLLPEWHEWSWHFGSNNGLIYPLTAKGCQAYLCRVPDETSLVLALKAAIQAGLLYTGPDTSDKEVVSASEKEEVIAATLTQLPKLNQTEERDLLTLDKAS